MLDLNHKTILITGASSGIGEAIARSLGQTGARLVLTARRLDRLESLTSSLKEMQDCDCLAIKLDVSNKAEVHNLLPSLPKEWRDIDILVNNAGLALSTDPIQSGSEDNWDIMIDTNLKGLLYVSRAVLPGMVERSFGHIVNIGSIAGEECYPNGNVYSATKFAVHAISKSMRLDLAGTGIRITEIAPGAVETEFSMVRWNDKKKADAFYQDFNPLLAEDIADAVHYCITRPLHVDIAKMNIMATDQAAASIISRKGRCP